MVEQTDRRGQAVKTRSLARDWSIDVAAGIRSLIVAADKIVCGSEGKVIIVDARAQQVLTSFEIEGTVLGLVATEGRLFVSTNDGVIYCFAESAAGRVSHAAGSQVNDVVRASDELAAQAAEEIIRRTGITDGFCLDLGAGDGALTCELARRTQLRVIAVDDEPAMVDAARRRVEAAGLDGQRVTFQCRELDSTGYPPYFANLSRIGFYRISAVLCQLDCFWTIHPSRHRDDRLERSPPASAPLRWDGLCGQTW
jgi:hypothetical protein